MNKLKMIKVEFPYESMWVKSWDDGIGFLCNDSVYYDIKWGSVVSFLKDDIHDYICLYVINTDGVKYSMFYDKEYDQFEYYIGKQDEVFERIERYNHIK